MIVPLKNERELPSVNDRDLRRIYDLRPGDYSAELSRFSDNVLREIELRAAPLTHNYSYFVQHELKEPARSLGEYAIELLTLGLEFRLYEAAAENTHEWTIQLSKNLFRMRRKVAGLKPAIDLLRTALTQTFFLRALRHPVIKKRTTTNAHSAEGLSRLIAWLEATGEFEQESRRLKQWASYFATLTEEQAAECCAIAIGLFDWFEMEAERTLGGYTRGVQPFLEGEYARRSWREDQLFCGKRAVEYHLSMVASEVMNRGLRPGFEAKHHKAVLVPACMRGDFASRCKAKTTGVDIRCAACSPGCAVNQLTERMRGMGATVYLVPHSTGFSRWLERWQREPDTGVVAVACLLNILPGGYEMRARGIASQCIPLDYPGCKKHWNRNGIPTSFNQERLIQILAPDCVNARH